MKTIQAWAARDMDDTLWLYLNKPVKARNQWVCNAESPFLADNLDLSNVKWEDEEPTEVEITIKVK